MDRRFSSPKLKTSHHKDTRSNETVQVVVLAVEEVPVRAVFVSPVWAASAGIPVVVLFVGAVVVIVPLSTILTSLVTSVTSSIRCSSSKW